MITNNFFFYCRMARRNKSKSRSRRARKTVRRVRGKRCWSGGANQLVLPATVENSSYDSSFSSPSKMMLGQGNEYQSLHSGQHGGAVAINPSPAPPGYTGVLEDGLRDESLKAIQGMSDQAGGARRRRRGSKRRGSKKRGSKKRGSKKRGTRRMRGGAAYSIADAQDFRAPGMLLSPAQEQTALGGMNPEWKLAMDPNSFAPNLSK
jgi:hypothetical protein